MRKLSAEIPARFVAFDVLVWDRRRALAGSRSSKRRATLEEVAQRLRRCRPVTRDLDEALAWLDSFEAIGLDGVIAKRRDKPYLRRARATAVVKVKPEKTADCVVAGLRWKADGERGSRRSCSGSTTTTATSTTSAPPPSRPRGTTRSRRASLPLLQNAPERRFSEPNRWGGGELEESPVRPELVVEVRYDKVQGRALPPRDEAHPASARQEPGAVHVARAPPAARGRRLLDRLMHPADARNRSRT